VAAGPSLNDTTAPRVSVCIANYNGEALLTDCIDSVLAQEGDAAVEILVHDDASGDGSLALLRARYPDVRVIASDRNVGFCAANNRMADAARGDYLLLLNNDAALEHDALARLLTEAARIGAPAILTLPQYDWKTEALVDRGCLLDPFYNPIPNLDPDRADVAYVIGACLWIPRDAWHALGGFPEAFGSLAEDMFLCCLARLRGLPVRAINSSGYRHRQGASFGGNRSTGARLRSTYRRRALSELNKTITLVACTPTPLMAPLLALHLAALALEGVAMGMVRRDARAWKDIYAPALTLVFRHWRALRAQRQQVQLGRRCSLRGYLHAFRWAPRKLVLLGRHGVPDLR
jgi:GT2 family glycosyltransferase